MKNGEKIRTSRNLHTDKLISVSLFENILSLFLISFLTLFWEIVFIRWIPSNVHIIGFFTNIVLMACFLGLSAGCILAYKKINFVQVFPLLLLAVIVLVIHLGGFSVGTLREDYIFEAPPRASALELYTLLIIVFVFITVTFICLGQELGKQMNKLKPLTAYAVNIGGSISGIVFFTIMSYLSVQPIVWFAIGIFLCLWFFRKNRIALISNIIIAVVILITLFPRDTSERWSPYYKLNIVPLGSKPNNLLGYALAVNNQRLQYIIRFDNYLTRTSLGFWKDVYSLPYYFGSMKDVLLLGAGAGNDAAIAIRHGAEHIDIVEIDPEIIKIGKELHPEDPYNNNKVKTYATDARAFLRNTKKKYDLITFGTLDSHTLFSNMANLRLDNYMYTKEAIVEVKNHLKNNGILAIMIGTPRPWIGNRIFQLLKEVFKSSPHVYYTKNRLGIVVFLSSNGAALSGENLPESIKKHATIGFISPVPLCTDDWPYFYMEKRTIPPAYLKVLLFILIFSGVLVFLSIPRKQKKRFDFHFFFLGSAFMLLETKGITTIALLFGSTWVVNSVVISAILTMILIATLYVRKFGALPTTLCYILLITTIIFNYLFPLEKLFIQNIILRMLTSGLLVALPMFFSAIIFAESFKSVTHINVCFGSNLFGAMVGGVCEYSSLIYGLNSLYIIAIMLYIFSWLARKNIR